MSIGSNRVLNPNRRQLLANAAALGLVSAMGGHANSQAKKGGRLRWASPEGATSDTLDPTTLITIFTYVVNCQVRNSLTEVDAKGGLVPELAESWDTKDGSTWVFKLRKGVEFHNGKEFVADDVIHSLNIHRGKDSKSAVKPLVETIAELKADGKHEVVMTLSGRNADLPFLMSDFRLTMIPNGMSPSEMANTAIGTGGYILQEFVPGVRALAKRNPNYWKADRAHFDEIESLQISDVTARNNALIAGEIDVMLRPDLQLIDKIVANGGIKFVETQGGYHFTFPMRADVKPFSDNNIRMAIKLAIDRQELLDKILLGHGYLGNDHPIGRANLFFNADLPQRTYDPEKAKWYLKQAGMESLSVPLSVSEAAFTGALNAGQLIKERAAAANITVDLINEPADTYWDNVWQKKPWVASSWNGRPTEDMLFSTVYAAGVPWNESGWNNEAFNKLLIAARGELDQAKRREMYYEMQRLLSDEGATVIPLFSNYTVLTSDKIGMGPIAGNWEFDGYRAPERWYFA